MEQPNAPKKRKPPVRHKVDELEAMRQCDRIISKVECTEERGRVVKWLYDRYNPEFGTDEELPDLD